MVLAGCASNQQALHEITAPQMRSIGWVKQDWRICNDDACPKPTPKTVELPGPQMAAGVQPANPANPDKERVTQTRAVREPVVVHFEFAKAIPVGDWERAFSSIERQVAPSDTLLIHAYTDDLGSERYNDRLAQQRADFVLSQLKARGIKNPMEVKAKGKCCYVEPNDTDAGRAANRRAEVHFIKKGDRQ
jgi:outer membrane protein OmpA-like peptidoglycan-associated protein